MYTFDETNIEGEIQSWDADRVFCFLISQYVSPKVADNLLEAGLDGDMLLTYTKKDYCQLEIGLKIAEIHKVIKVKNEYIHQNHKNSMNKAYKLHVKFESGKETFSCLPDTSVGQLKAKIGAEFQVPPSQLVLFCNGKLLQGDDYQTLRQARVCSGSKILARRGEICSEREAELKSRLRKVEEEGERLGQEVARLAAASPRQEVTVQLKENKMVREQLMRLLETLDGISLGQDMFELRARRKKAAARINSLMDTNDSNIQAIDEVYMS